MQLFDIVNLVGMTPDNIPVLDNIRIHDHDEVLTPGESNFAIFISSSKKSSFLKITFRFVQ